MTEVTPNLGIAAIVLLAIATSCHSGGPEGRRIALSQAPQAAQDGSAATPRPTGDSSGTVGSSPGINTNPDNQRAQNLCQESGKLVGPDSAYGQIRIKLPERINPCHMEGLLVGPTVVPLQISGSGIPFFDRLPQGRYDIILYHPINSSLGLQSTKKAGVRVNNIAVINGEITEITAPEFQETTRLTGVVSRLGEETLAGTLVKLDGTSISVTTGPDGTWVFEDLVPGQHDLIFTAPGYEPGFVRKQLVESGGESEAPPIELLRKNTGSAVLRIAGGIEPDLNIGFYLVPTSPPEEMRFGETADLSGQAWVTFRSFASFLVAADDGIRTTGKTRKTLFVELKTGETITAHKITFDIDLFFDLRADNLPPGRAVVEVVGRGPDGTMPRPNFLIRTILPTAASSRKMGFSAEFAEAPFLEPTGESSQQKVTREGEHTFQVQFRTPEGYRSEVYSVTFRVDVFPLNSVAFLLDPPRQTALYPAKISAIEVQFPRPTNTIKLAFARNDSFSEPFLTDPATTIALPYDDDFPCGASPIFLKVIEEGSGIESATVRQIFIRDCNLPVDFGTDSSDFTSRTSVGTLTAQDRWFFFGGAAGDSKKGDGYIVDLENQTVTSWPADQRVSPRSSPNLQWLGNSVLVMGGNLTNKGLHPAATLNATGIFNPQEGLWSIVGSFPHGAGDYLLLPGPQHIWAFDPATGKGAYFSLQKKVWTAMTPFPDLLSTNDSMDQVRAALTRFRQVPRPYAASSRYFFRVATASTTQVFDRHHNKWLLLPEAPRAFNGDNNDLFRFWTGKELLLWGGNLTEPLAYNPTNQSWRVGPVASETFSAGAGVETILREDQLYFLRFSPNSSGRLNLGDLSVTAISGDAALAEGFQQNITKADETTYILDPFLQAIGMGNSKRFVWTNNDAGANQGFLNSSQTFVLPSSQWEELSHDFSLITQTFPLHFFAPQILSNGGRGLFSGGVDPDSIIIGQNDSTTWRENDVPYLYFLEKNPLTLQTVTFNPGVSYPQTVLQPGTTSSVAVTFRNYDLPLTAVGLTATSDSLTISELKAGTVNFPAQAEKKFDAWFNVTVPPTAVTGTSATITLNYQGSGVAGSFDIPVLISTPVMTLIQPNPFPVVGENPGPGTTVSDIVALQVKNFGSFPFPGDDTATVTTTVGSCIDAANVTLTDGLNVLESKNLSLTLTVSADCTAEEEANFTIHFNSPLPNGDTYTQSTVISFPVGSPN